MNEMIEKLKKNERPFGLLTLEEQECLKKVSKENCVIFNETWVTPCRLRQPFENKFTYAIKPDYKPEPEFVDLEIIKDNFGWLGILDVEPPIAPKADFTHLHCLPSLPGFQCFWEEPKGFHGYMLNRAFWTIGLVSPKLDEGKTVYARFRKEKP